MFYVLAFSEQNSFFLFSSGFNRFASQVSLSVSRLDVCNELFCLIKINLLLA